jgi:regulator of RNase E activity RraA
VIVIQPANLDAVLEAAEDICRREAGMLAEIERGTRMSDVLAGNYENMLKKV